MDRRRLLELIAAGMVAPAAGAARAAASAASGTPGRPSHASSLLPVDPGRTDDAPATRLAAAWRGLATDSAQQVGAIEIDWAARAVRIASVVPVPSRAHGLLAEPGGGWLAIAFRPGSWLWRFDADGRVTARASTDDEPHGRKFTGHVIASPDGERLFTSEYDAASGEGRIGVRDRRTLRKLDEWASGGLDPHHLTTDVRGRLLIANGGLPRAPDGRKRDLDRMDSSLVAMDASSGRHLDAWRLQDRRLGLRHLAWSTAPDGTPLLGIALQAEHAEPTRRAQAPVLATWDGTTLDVPSRAADGEGYAGDIAAAAGGFVVTCQPARVALHWDASRPAALTPIARMHEACAVAPVAVADGGVVVAGALGVGRWHPAMPAVMLRWPMPMALDNHWVELARPG
ncbi:MAG: DUF1513 domain-containing protein [Burkholderiales bacterium]|nr:MAG: DUF1513 domain-containing protein [Burkholderiales bacterium]